MEVRYFALFRSMSNIGKLAIHFAQNTYTIYSANLNRLLYVGRLGYVVFNCNTHFKYSYTNTKSTVIAKAVLLEQWGVLAALLKQIYSGIQKGYNQRLELAGIGFKVLNTTRMLLFKLGYSHIKRFKYNTMQTRIVCSTPTSILIQSILPRDTFLLAYKIHRLRKPDVYKNKGIKILGNFLIKKPGKKKK